LKTQAVFKGARS